MKHTLCLLILVISSWQLASGCYTLFNDSQSKAYLAPVVFEGEATIRSVVVLSTYSAVFRVAKVFKGEIGPNKVKVINFVSDSRSRCHADVTVGNRYLIFANKSRNANNATGELETFVIFGPPAISTKKEKNLIRKALCEGCGQPPVVKLPVKSILAAGQEGEILCRAIAVPRAKVQWFHNGAQIRSGGPMYTIADGRVRSRLIFNNVTKHHTGTYYCVARNILGGPVNKSVNLEVKPSIHAYPSFCPDNGYCFNNGTCLTITDSATLFCICTAYWQGKRCQLRVFGPPDSNIILPPRDSVLSTGSFVSSQDPIIWFGVIISSLILLMIVLCVIYRNRLNNKIIKSRQENARLRMLLDQASAPRDNPCSIVVSTGTQAPDVQHGDVVQHENGVEFRPHRSSQQMAPERSSQLSTASSRLRKLATSTSVEPEQAEALELGEMRTDQSTDGLLIVAEGQNHRRNSRHNSNQRDPSGSRTHFGSDRKDRLSSSAAQGSHLSPEENPLLQNGAPGEPLLPRNSTS